MASPDELWTAVVEAFGGGPAVAPIPPDGAAWTAAMAPDRPLEVGDAAAVVSTSGSTGDAKGVVLTRAALLASAAATHRRLGGPGTWVSALPTHYVAGFMTLVRALEAGTVARRVPGDLSGLSLAPGRNYVSVVPAQVHRALDDPSVVGALAGFDAVLVGGAAASDDLLGRARRAGINVVATYGMAETCGGCVYDGVPLDGMDVALDGGRISLAGPMLFSGYRLDPEATRAALDGGRLLTRDRGEWRDGRLAVLGRVDDVVVTGGVNVDLARAQAACDDAFGPALAGGLLLVAVPDERWGVRIEALTTGGWTEGDARARLAGRVGPEAMPRRVHPVEVLPLTPTGKIDPRAAVRVAEGS